MARPRKQPKEQRTESVRATLTVEEKLHVQRQAEAAGVTEAEYTRRRVLGYNVPPARSLTDTALISEINRIGVNVHQLVRDNNFKRSFTIGWQGVLAELHGVLKTVSARYDS